MRYLLICGSVETRLLRTEPSRFTWTMLFPLAWRGLRMGRVAMCLMMETMLSIGNGHIRSLGVFREKLSFLIFSARFLRRYGDKKKTSSLITMNYHTD